MVVFDLEVDDWIVETVVRVVVARELYAENSVFVTIAFYSFVEADLVEYGFRYEKVRGCERRV